jgi:AbrB family looped-hinge helix DNA binding protein
MVSGMVKDSKMVPVSARINNNGTITIPLAIRESLGLKIGDKVKIWIPLAQ